ncbi:uncharacterized protein PHALS_11606 [Plasmopara halstedii]|uniref:Uncharacterized protein n=1 Tax=Plasmopara halstedii TaxID=4781 RepID=A0A0P1AKX8_PLAHL|nr:uncharacterized protein PHALS_11606 [Plasmopara halstedii]CEG41245.1 hypothetical protein PHALS_11606 [Plasmopara halstedii]|eukprot:XP_024577614.1 hypothetical protein PHALS_11606 [Plasmopara halstedii]
MSILLLTKETVSDLGEGAMLKFLPIPSSLLDDRELSLFVGDQETEIHLEDASKRHVQGSGQVNTS